MRPKTSLNSTLRLPWQVNELGNLGNGIFPMLAMTDTQDSRQKVMQLMTLTPMFSAEDYEDPENVMLQEYRETLIAQLLKSGEKQAEAKRLADGLLQMEKALSEQASSMEELGSLQSQINRYTPSALDAMMPQAKPSELLAAIGLPSNTRMQVFDDKQFAAYAQWFTEDNLELFKAMQKSALISGFSRYLEPLSRPTRFRRKPMKPCRCFSLRSWVSCTFNVISQLKPKPKSRTWCS